MGTRGLMAFAHDGQIKGTYNHYDSYPSGLGRDVVTWARNADFTEAIAKFARLQAINEDEKPTDEQRAQLAEYTNTNVSTGDDWYATLREAQGDPGKTLDAGFYSEYTEFALDSLFCEWAYVVDLDNRTVEIYRGFQKTPPKNGRWVGQRQEDHRGYYPVELVAVYDVATGKLSRVGGEPDEPVTEEVQKVLL